MQDTNKRVAYGNYSPLGNSSILLHVLNFVGPGHHLFTAATSKDFAECSKLVDSVQATDIRNCHIKHSCKANMTSFSACFASIATLHWACDCGLPLKGLEGREAVQRMAGKVADIATLTEARAMGLFFQQEVTVGVALSGSLAKLRWLLLEQTWQIPEHLSMYAACSGSLDMLRWSADLACTFTEHASEAAARASLVHVVDWLRTEGHPWNGSALCEIAAGAGDLQMLKYLKQHTAFSSSTLAAAARAGQLHVCAFLHSERCPSDLKACASAAAKGHCSTLRWLRQHGYAWNSGNIHRLAALGGNVDVLAYIFGSEPLSAYTEAAQLTRLLGIAGTCNHLAAAKWLRQRGAEWPAVLRYKKVYVWHGSTLEWARAEGCTSPVDP
jgi:hypothetical protein